MSDTIVIDGEVELLNVIDGDPDVCIGGGGSQPTGTKSILLTEAGTKTEDVTAYAYAEINAVKDATASGAVASFSDGAEDVPMASCVVNIEPVQSGSGDPSPSNVRPISGWSEVKVTRAGKNLWNPATVNDGMAIDANGNLATNGYRMTSDYIKVTTGSYYLTNVVGSSLARTCVTYDANKAFKRVIGISGSGIVSGAISIVDGEEYIRVVSNSGQTGVQVERGSVQTSYEPYTAQGHPISLGQTVYGGTLDVVSGVLTVDRAMVDLGTRTWGKTTGGSSDDRYFSQSLNTVIKKPSANSVVANISCEEFVTASANNGFAGNVKNSITVDTAGTVSIYPTTNYTDASTFKTAMSGVKLVYELATAQTIQLTPTEVKTLLGSNNVWADSGNISVGYKADIFLYAESLETIIDTLTGGA